MQFMDDPGDPVRTDHNRFDKSRTATEESSSSTGQQSVSSKRDLLHTAAVEMGYSVRFVRRPGGRLLLVFAGVLLPLWGFGALVEELHEGAIFPFDLPILHGVHALANAGLDRVFLFVSALGFVWGVVPVDALLILGLAWRRRAREGLFAGLSIVGSLLLNLIAKHTFARARPDLWQWIVKEASYSFPSGHAMGSITLAWVLVLLCWNRRSRWGWNWRWPVTLVAVLFVLLVGLSRIYLGVHFPSDILAGWAAASVWVVGMYGLVFYGTLRPWHAPTTHGSA
jgi:undecaprenyl-diphosphatase